MTSLELQMVESLKELRDKYAVTEVKAEFEAEGTRLDELLRLKDIISQADLELVLKIGGAEAIRDLYDSQLIGAAGIMAPMVESGYAMTKYLAAVESSFSNDVKEQLSFSINVETKNAVDNLDEILNAPGNERLSAICIGRVDLSGSLGLSRDEINGEQVSKIVRQVFTVSRKRNLKNKMGGGISADAVPLIKELISEELLDQYETRKIVFNITNPDPVSAIKKAAEFELLWLKNKKNYYTRISTEDDKRIKMIESRI